MVDLLLVDVNLLDDLGDLLVEDVDDLLFGFSQWSENRFSDMLWFSDMVDNLLDVVDLVDQFSDNGSEVNNLLLEDWFLVSWGRLVLLLKNNELLSDDGDLLDGLLNGGLENSDDLLLNWGSSWSSSWVSDSNDGSLDNVDLVDVLSDDSLKNNDLSMDGWSLVDWSSSVLSSEDLDGLGDLGDLLSDMGDLSLENLDDLLGDWSPWSWETGWLFWFFSSWSARRSWLSQNVGDMGTSVILLAILSTGWFELLTG